MIFERTLINMFLYICIYIYMDKIYGCALCVLGPLPRPAPSGILPLHPPRMGGLLELLYNSFEISL